MSAKFWLVMCLVFCLCGELLAAEPNDDFWQATVLPAGVTTVDDNVTGGVVSSPDTYLGTLNFFGGIQFEDDDSSIYGDGTASGVSSVSVNPGGTIDFLVTGYDDFDFTGDHFEYGEYEVVIDIYDFSGDHIERYFDYRTMQPGNVDSFSITGDETWLNGTYDVNINNLYGLPEGGDVDFFTFTGLTPGATFFAEVTQENLGGFDSILGWFDEAGILIGLDDDSGVEALSLIEGVVPEEGELTFAVTGWSDDNFQGFHDFNEDYSLELTFSSVGIDGDFDHDGDVDGRDFLVWQRGGSPDPYSAEDLALWQGEYGQLEGALAGVTAVPEPGALGLVAMATCLGMRRQRLR